jgi:hypothetical protein
MKNLFLLFATVALAGTMFSCQKSSDADQVTDITVAEDEVFMLKSIEEVDELVSAASFGAEMSSSEIKAGFFRFFPYKNFPECAEVTVSTDGFPKEIFIDFGDECVTRNGLPITGTISITLSDTMKKAGAEMTVIYDALTVGLRVFDLESTTLNEGINDSGNWVMSHSTISTVTYGDGHTVTRDFAGEKEWIDGFLTPDHFDNKFYRTGGGTITINDDIVFTRTITVPLYIDRACRFILSGVIEITRNDETMTIDFGDGVCDNLAIVTKGDVSEEIELNTCRFRTGFERHTKNFRRANGWW